jgi:hypothetical protein
VRLAALFLLVGSCFAQGVWTMGRWDSGHPLRTNRQTLRDWKFWAPQITALSVTAIDAYSNRNKAYGCCGRAMEHGTSLAVDAGVPALLGVGASYLMDRFLWRPFGYGIAGYFIVRHGRGAVTGRYP